MTNRPTTDEQLPIAVYGTLRVGHSNHRLMAGRTSDIAMGIVDSHELVVDGLPFARPSTRGGLVAEVMWPLPLIYDEVLTDLDRLESYHPERPEASFYIRTEVTVRTAHGDVQAWLYEAGQRARVRLRHLPATASGDYSTVRSPTTEAVA